MSKTIVAILLLCISCWACSKGTAANGSQQPNGVVATQSANGELKYKVPEGWVVEKPSSSMRVAQYKLPKAAGDSEDASLVLYYFGQGQGGGTQANIDRWINQMHQPDGSPPSSKAKSETLTVNGLKVTTVDAVGTYSAEMTPGSGNFSSNDNYRLRGAVVETPKGSYFVKLVGPAKTVEQWNAAFDSYVKSFEFK
ncbi:MAG: hypothetical protein C5B55_06900 [Blastocatellia bacterium]|nr:MAG: hypothetical protein C5B55_06900 [Blastocatellia bacterium]